MSNDYLQKFIFEDVPVSGCLVRLEASWQEVQHRARPDAETREMLGQALCAAAVLGSSIKFDGTVSLQVQSSGSLRLLLGQCSSQNQLRGITHRNPDAGNEGEGRGALLVDPVLSINLEPEGSGMPYQGIVSMAEGSLAGALEYYFTQSEQLQTRFWFVVNEQVCAGFMLQRMPGESAGDDGFERLVHLASTLRDTELINQDPARLLHLLFNEDNVRLFDAEPLRFGCKCSPERVAGVLQSLGLEEMQSLLAERGTVDVNCEYCGKEYRYDPVDIAGLFNDSPARLESSSAFH